MTKNMKEPSIFGGLFLYIVLGMDKKQNLKIKDWAEDDRPREKLLKRGIDSLTDAELIAILLGSGNSEDSAVELAKKILLKVRNN